MEDAIRQVLSACVSLRIKQDAVLNTWALKMQTQVLLLYSTSNNKLAEKRS
jgi:hypothetical protein